MRIAPRAENLSSQHANGTIGFLFHMIRDGPKEARPACSRFKFRRRIEDRQFAADANVRTVLVMMEQVSTEGLLRSLASGYCVLLGCEQRLPLCV